MQRDRTYKGGSKVLEVDRKSGLDSASSGHNTSRLERALDDTQRVVKGPLHLIEHVIFTEKGPDSAPMGNTQANKLADLRMHKAHRWLLGG